MGEVVGMPTREPEELIFICNCGCRTFRIMSTGFVECSSCEVRMSDEVTGYRPEVVTEVSEPSDVHQRHELPDDSLAFRRIAYGASPDNTAAIIVMRLDGSVSAWSQGYDRPETKNWFQKRVDGLMELLK